MTRKPTKKQTEFETRFFAWGVTIGTLVGGVLALLFLPKRATKPQQSITKLTQQARDKIETTVMADPVETSLQMGKDAARRRRDELGLPAQEERA